MYSTDCGIGNSKPFTNGGDEFPTAFKRSYFSHFIPRKLRSSQAFIIPPALRFISHVLSVGSKSEVVRVYARRVIAIMKHLKTFRNVSNVNQKRNSMRSENRFAHAERAISTTFRAGPQPAFSEFRFVNWNRSFFVNFHPKPVDIFRF